MTRSTVRPLVGALAATGLLGGAAVAYAPTASAEAPPGLVRAVSTIAIAPVVTARNVPVQCATSRRVAGKDSWLFAVTRGKVVAVRLTLTGTAGKTFSASSATGGLIFAAGARALVRSAPAGLTLVRVEADVQGAKAGLTLRVGCPALTAAAPVAAPAPKPPPNPAPKPAPVPAPKPARAQFTPAQGAATTAAPAPNPSVTAAPSEAAAIPSPTLSAEPEPTPTPSASDGATTVVEVAAPVAAAGKPRAGEANWTMVALAASLLLLVSAAVGGALVVRARRAPDIG